MPLFTRENINCSQMEAKWGEHRNWQGLSCFLFHLIAVATSQVPSKASQSGCLLVAHPPSSCFWPLAHRIPDPCILLCSCPGSIACGRGHCLWDDFVNHPQCGQVWACRPSCGRRPGFLMPVSFIVFGRLPSNHVCFLSNSTWPTSEHLWTLKTIFFIISRFLFYSCI